MVHALTKSEKAIEKRLTAALQPESFELVNESHLHKGHAGAEDGRGHFALTVVSDKFNGLATLARHRLVYDAMGELMQTDIHALSIKAFSPDEL
ncbi:MAG: BolA family protein [Arenicellales bacterium WSBS_2016_MAG_OTU3]